MSSRFRCKKCGGTFPNKFCALHHPCFENELEIINAQVMPKKKNPVTVYLRSLETKSSPNPFSHSCWQVKIGIDLYGDQPDVQRLIEKMRANLPIVLTSMSTNDEDYKSKFEKINDESADFILAQYSKIMEFLEKKKFEVASVYFELSEKMYSEYQTNPRWEEINSTRNMVWDQLAKRGLIKF